LDFNLFLENIPKIKSTKLGGLTSQFKLAPAVRIPAKFDEIVKKNPKEAAVLALLYPNKQNKTCFILTKRASYKGVHSSQISFPGGKQEPFDIDLKQTALRETSEEIGVSNVSIIRSLTKTYIPPSNFYVTPYLGYIDKIQMLMPNEEVSQILEIDLDDFLSDSSLSVQKMSTSYMENVDVPCFKLNNEIVWGATAMMLSEIKDLFKEVLH